MQNVSALAGAFAIMTACTAQAETAGRHVFGFAPDGRYFAYEQFLSVPETGHVSAAIGVIDTRSDSDVPGTPITAQGRTEADLARVRTQVHVRARAILDRLRISQPGEKFAADSTMALGIARATQVSGTQVLALQLADGRRARLELETRRNLRWSVCVSAQGNERDVQAAGVLLRLVVDGSPTRVIHNDERLPPERRCASDYALTEAHVHRTASGGETIAVLLTFADHDQAGTNPHRRHFVVTRPLNAPAQLTR